MSRLAIAHETGVSNTQVRRWIGRGLDAVLNSPMRRNAPKCDESGCELVTNVDERAYAYLLGMYLGDGTITTGRRDVERLRVSVCDDQPGIRAECIAAIEAVMPGNKVGLLRRKGCHDVSCYSKHWSCLFPQHGPGRKHTRPMLLRQWQLRIAFDLHPDLLLRGLVHSDGCRGINKVRKHVASGTRHYAYPRYFFRNESGHIRGFFIEGCRRLGVDYRYNNPTSISVARRASVAILDSFIGPKC